MARTFIVERPAGSAWVAGRGAREQPLWDEHAVFMDVLFEGGAVVLGGPLADGGAVLVMEAENEDEVRRLLAGDPWMVEAAVQGVGHIREWEIFLDAREKE